MSDRSRSWWWVGIAVAAVLAVLAPMFRAPAPDGFPLSTYPMFARDRGGEAWLATAVGRTADDTVVRLSPTLIAGTDEPVQASATVARAVADGSTVTLCREVATRVARSDRDDVVTVEVVSERHDLGRVEPDGPRDRREHTSCAVAR